MSVKISSGNTVSRVRDAKPQRRTLTLYANDNKDVALCSSLASLRSGTHLELKLSIRTQPTENIKFDFFYLKKLVFDI